MVVTKGTAHADYFSTADQTSSPVQAKLWERMKDDPNSLLMTLNEIEHLLINDLNYVYFGSYTDTVLGMSSVPCIIIPTSKSIFKVCPTIIQHQFVKDKP